MKADKCPHCRAPLEKKGAGCLRGILIVVCVAAFATCLSSSSTAKDNGKARVDEQKDFAEVPLNRVPEAVQKGSEGWEAEAAQRRAEAEALSAKNEKEKAEFLGSIQKHYQQLATYYKRKEFDQAAEVLNLFVLYDKLDYKDVDRILGKVTIWNIEKDLPSVPATDIERNIGLYTQLPI